MDHYAEDPRQALGKFRHYLCVLARMHLDRSLWTKLDPDDVVQTTFQHALEKWDQFRGSGDEQLKAWLRQMLLHNIFDAVRAFRQQKCDVLLEQPLEQSSARLLDSLAAEQSSPSQRAVQNEQLLRLADALLHLPALRETCGADILVCHLILANTGRQECLPHKNPQSSRRAIKLRPTTPVGWRANLPNP